MNKRSLYAVFTAVLSLAACSSEPAISGVDTKAAGPENSQTRPDAPAYWTGNGAKDLSIVVQVPEGRDLAINETYLPVMARGVLARDLKNFSAMDVLDREDQEADAEGKRGGAPSETTGNAQYVLNGVLRKTGSDFSLQLTITDPASGTSKAAYSGGFTQAELENLRGLKKASADLLAQLGVTLTDAGKTSLLEGETSNTEAETALAKGIVAQGRGAVVEALHWYYEAVKFDPGLAEAASRGASLLPDISGGGGQDALNAIQRRNEWAGILQEAAAFFREHPPYEIIYDPALTQGKIDYDRETVEMSFKVKITGTTGFKVIYDLDRELRRTGKSEDWGISTDSIWRAIPDWYGFNAALVNEKGEIIARTTGSFEPGKNLDFSHIDGVARFSGVEAGKITDKMTVSITPMNGVGAKAAGGQGYISISPEDFAALEVFPFKVDWRLGGVEITGYRGTDKQVVIPPKIGRWLVTAIGYRAFREKWLTSVTIPDTVIIIGDEAFSRNELTSVIIPDSVTFIGEAAFRDNRLTRVTISNRVTSISSAMFRDNQLTGVIIPDSVTSIGHWAFGKLTSITIPANVVLDKGGSFFGFDSLYEDNGRKAGTYDQDVSGKWSMRKEGS